MKKNKNNKLEEIKLQEQIEQIKLQEQIMRQTPEQVNFNNPPQDYNLTLLTDKEGLILLRDIGTGAIFQVMKRPLDGKAILEQLNFGRRQVQGFLQKFQI